MTHDSERGRSLVKNINNVNQSLKGATSWYSLYDVKEPGSGGRMTETRMEPVSVTDSALISKAHASILVAV